MLKFTYGKSINTKEDRAAGIRLLNRMERIGALHFFFESTGDELSIYADVLEKWQKEIENQVKKAKDLSIIVTILLKMF